MTQPLIAPRRPSTAGGATRRGPESVVRARLLRSLAQACDTAVALLVAPAGYGKTMLLEQWAQHDPRPFATLALRRADNDPAHLLESIARALGEVAPVADEVFVALSTPGGPVAADALARLERSLEECASPFVLALDDVGVLTAPGSLAVLAALADHVPAGAQLALASRCEPALPLGRLRAQRRLLELRVPELAMTRREAAALLHLAGLDLAPDDVLALVRRTEGWPAGLSVAAVAVRGEADPARAVRRFGGANRLLADYLRDELIGELPADWIRFLTRTSILDVLSGPVCDATLACSGSGAVLRDLARANVLVVPLDQSDTEYRYHGLLAEMLSAELRRAEPDLERELQQRACAWHTARDDLEGALRHAVAAGDAGAAGRLLWASAAPQLLCGHSGRIRSWLGRFSAEELAAEPGLALTTAALHLVLGDRDLAEHWAALAARALDAGAGAADRRAFAAGVAIIRAAVAGGGLARLRTDAPHASAPAADDDPWRSLSCLLAGVEAHLTGDLARARAELREGVRRGAVAAPAVQALCLAQLALVAIDEGDWSEAEALSSRARSQVERVGLGDCPLCALVFAVSARVRAQRGRAEQAQDDRRAALRLLAQLTDFLPWYEAEVRISLAGAALRLGDVAAMRALLAETSRNVRDTPGAPVLVEWIAQSRAAAEALAESVAGPSSLTTAELRVLRLLPTHLSFREMAGDLHVTANTIKTHAHAIYRKLDACSRSEAVDQARGAGLLGAAPDDLQRGTDQGSGTRCETCAA